ncbi:unnamed protein product [Rotaria sp. Silwood2]|nr:unnamed protein product [Rotaria sp. Silwood2]
MYEECDEHLLLLPSINDNEQESDSSAESDQLEIVSDAEDSENLLVRLNNYLNLDSADDTGLSSDEDHDQNRKKKFIDENEDEKDDDSDSPIVSNITCSITPHANPIADAVQSQQPSSKTIGESGSSKRKRRQWSIKEKLSALNVLGKNLGNKQLTAHQCGCSRYQLSQWAKSKAELEIMSKSKHSKKRKRLSGGGSKIKYIDLDYQLLLWFREKRTFIDPQSIATTVTTTTTTIRREKVTFRQLQRQGRLLSVQLQHDCPSTKWFARFMRRHRLSLQKPKRNQKIPLSDVYPLVNKFYDYIRRASLWAPSRGPMGAFLVQDVCNMDESPLNLFGDQSKLSINDINTSNDIEGCISNKRFATVILTIFGDDNTRVGPVLLFKGKGQVRDLEKSQYAKGVKVYFTPKAVNNRITMDNRIHRESRWRSKIKLTASESRILCTRLTLAAWKRTLASIDFKKSFRQIGYTWTDNITPVKPHTLPGYIYDPTDRNLTNSNMENDIIIEETNENETNLIITNKIANKQLKLSDFWKQ